MPVGVQLGDRRPAVSQPAVRAVAVGAVLGAAELHPVAVEGDLLRGSQVRPDAWATGWLTSSTSPGANGGRGVASRPTSRVTKAAVAAQSASSRARSVDTAMAGGPASAAPTVPGSVIPGPVLRPRFVPETTSSGGRPAARMAASLASTASAGVPATVRAPGASVSCRVRFPDVSAPEPLRLPSGESARS